MQESMSGSMLAVKGAFHGDFLSESFELFISILTPMDCQAVNRDVN